MEFNELTPEGKKFYRNVYAVIGYVCRKIEKFKKERNTFQVTMGELLRNELFKKIRQMEQEKIGEEVDLLNLNLADGNFMEVQEELVHINNEINKQSGKILKEFLENVEEKL